MQPNEYFFHINQRLEIAAGDALEFFSSRIEDFNGEDMWIAMPMRNTIPVYVPKGEKLLGHVTAQEGLLTSFESVLLDYRLNPIPVWLIKKPENIKQMQQRNFFRYRITLPVKYSLLDTNGMPVEESATAAVSRNLSGGGVLIIVPRNTNALPLGTKLWVEVTLSEQYIIETQAKVSRLDSRRLSGEDSLYLMGLEFLGMDEILKKKIISFLNSKILERRRKGML